MMHSLQNQVRQILGTLSLSELEYVKIVFAI